MTIVRGLFAALVWGLALAALTGCEGEPIRSYSVPRQEEDVTTGKVRLLAAIVPVGDETWFFKMVGRSDIIAMTEPAFKQVIDSLDFPKDGEKVTWVTPKGWTEDREKKKGMAGERKGVLKPDGAPGPLLTIDTLRGPAAAAVKPNVDRWRRVDLGLSPLSGRLLERVATPKTIKGHAITLVDMAGPGAEKKPTMPGPKHPPTRPQPGAGKGKGIRGLQYKLPAGWREVSTTPLPSATIEVRSANESAQLKISSLGGDMPGGLRGNVDRWRREVGLRDITPEELNNLRPLTVKAGTVEAKQLDFAGPERLSRVAWVVRGGGTWFFKFVGPTRLVRDELANFDQFLKSLQFTGAGE